MCKNCLKTLSAMPLALYTYIYSLIAPPMDDISAAELLKSNVLGQITQGEETRLVFALGSIGFIIVFDILFGTYISEHFCYMPSYNFTRIHRREKWFWRRCMGLFGYAVIYACLYLGTSMWACSMIAAQGADQEMWKCFGILFVICVCLLMITTVLINLLTILWKIAIGFLSCYLGVLLLLQMAMKTIRFPLLQFLNPLSFVQIYDSTSMQIWEKLIYMVFLMLAVIALGGKFLKHYDITLKEVN